MNIFELENGQTVERERLYPRSYARWPRGKLQCLPGKQKIYPIRITERVLVSDLVLDSISMTHLIIGNDPCGHRPHTYDPPGHDNLCVCV
jgi:hypothetical protein